MTRGLTWPEELELLTDIRDFTTLFYVILRRKSSKWLELCIESDIGMRFAGRFAIWSLDWSWLSRSLRFAFFKLSSWCKNRLLQRISYLLNYFRDSGKRNYIRDPWPSGFFSFVNRAREPPVLPSRKTWNAYNTLLCNFEAVTMRFTLYKMALFHCHQPKMKNTNSVLSKCQKLVLI